MISDNAVIIEHIIKDTTDCIIILIVIIIISIVILNIISM